MRLIGDKQLQLEKQKEQIQKLNLEYTQKRNEIDIKDNIIHMREK